MKYVILLTILILARLDNVETPEEVNQMRKSPAAKANIDDQSKLLFTKLSPRHLQRNGPRRCMTMNLSMFT
jgi:hypothetical protein